MLHQRIYYVNIIVGGDDMMEIIVCELLVVFIIALMLDLSR